MCQRVDLGNGQTAIVCGGRKPRPKVTLPATPDELRRAGWHIEVKRACRMCGTLLEFWRTRNEKLMPLEAVPTPGDGLWRLVSHFATCPHADKFRREPAKAGQVAPKQQSLFGGAA